MSSLVVLLANKLLDIKVQEENYKMTAAKRRDQQRMEERQVCRRWDVEESNDQHYFRNCRQHKAGNEKVLSKRSFALLSDVPQDAQKALVLVLLAFRVID